MAAKVPLSTTKGDKSMSPPFVYLSEVWLDDGTFRVLDLEKPGWADKDLLKRITRWSLVPKPDFPQYPIVVINIPPGAKPIFNSRVYGKIGLSTSEILTQFRVYRIGYMRGRMKHWTWVMPNGSIESSTGDDSWLAEVWLQHLVAAQRQLNVEPEQEPESNS